MTDRSMKIRPVPDNDALLVARARRGEERAFKALYDRFARYVAGVVFRVLGSDGDLDDIVQDTFLEAYSSLSRLRNPERVKPWLATIAVRQTYRCLSRRERHRRNSRAAHDFSTINVPAGDRELLSEIYRILESQPAKLRIPWVLHCLQGETHEATAELCGISVSTAKRRIAKAQRQIRGRFDHGR